LSQGCEVPSSFCELPLDALCLWWQALGATPSRQTPPPPASSLYGVPQGGMLPPHYEEPGNWQAPSNLGTPSAPSYGGAPTDLGSRRGIPAPGLVGPGGGAPVRPGSQEPWGVAD